MDFPPNSRRNTYVVIENLENRNPQRWEEKAAVIRDNCC